MQVQIFMYICHMIKLSTVPFIVYVLLYINHCLIMNHKNLILTRVRCFQNELQAIVGDFYSTNA